MGWQDALSVAIVTQQDFEHINHAALLLVCCLLQDSLKGWGDSQVQCFAFGFSKMHMRPSVPVSVQLRYCTHIQVYATLETARFWAVPNAIFYFSPGVEELICCQSSAITFQSTARSTETTLF